MATTATTKGTTPKKNITSFYLGYFMIMFTRLKLFGVLVFPNKSYCVASLSLSSPSSLLKFPLLGSQKYVLFTYVRWAFGSQ